MLVVSRLTELAGLINAAHQDCRRSFDESQEQAHKSLTYAREAGRWLNQAKPEVQWGSWGAWVAENCPGISERTARAYMQIDREWEQLSALPGFGQLDYSTALALLGKLNQPEPEVVVAELVEDAPAPTPKPAQFEVGQQVEVASAKSLHAGEQVEIVGKRGGVLIGQTKDGEYPFLPGELRPLAEAPSAPLKALPQPSPKERLAVAVHLLQKTLAAPIPSELAAEITAFLLA